MRLIPTSLALLALLSAVPAAADCPEHFAGGAEPALVNPRLATRARELCYRGYAILHSGATRTPLLSAEHLTAERVEAAYGAQRTDLSHPEGRLPPGERSDYARSGYDRGHIAPSGDMPDEGSQAESFSLADVVPQAHRNNTGLWSEIEGAVRGLARRDGEVYVVTGPMFQGADLQLCCVAGWSCPIRRSRRSTTRNAGRQGLPGAEYRRRGLRGGLDRAPARADRLARVSRLAGSGEGRHTPASQTASLRAALPPSMIRRRAIPRFDPFADDAVYGSLDLTRDLAGLKLARKLKAVLDAVVRYLEGARDLPDAVPAPEEPTSVKNPFG